MTFSGTAHRYLAGKADRSYYVQQRQIPVSCSSTERRGVSFPEGVILNIWTRDLKQSLEIAYPVVECFRSSCVVLTSSSSLATSTTSSSCLLEAVFSILAEAKLTRGE